MKQHELSLRCVNCGTPLAIDDFPEFYDESGPARFCPVCRFRLTPTEARPSLSLADLESQISATVGDARSSGLPLDEIVQVLRDELAFAAEMANAGRHVRVQIIDLGPQDIGSIMASEPDRRESLLSRGVQN